MRINPASAFVLIGVLAFGGARAERSFEAFPQLGPLERITLSNLQGDRLDIVRHAGEETRPALVILGGSLCAPLFAAIGEDDEIQVFATVPLVSEEDKAELKSHVVYLERRNIVSLETMSSAREFTVEEIFRLSPCSSRNGGLTLRQRVDDALVQLRWLKDQRWVESIHLVGVSEGSDVAAAVAAFDGCLVDSLMLVGGAGPSQFADFAAFARSENDVERVAQTFADLDSFLSGSPPPTYKGYDSARWQSFAVETSVLDQLKESNVPLFIAHGDRDENVPIGSADLVAIEIMRKQPERPLFYWSVVGGGHMLETPAGSQMAEALSAYLHWATSSPSGRRFRTD